MIPHRQLQRLGLDRRTGDHHITADEAVLDTSVDVTDAAIFQHHRVLDLAVLDRHVVVDAGERPNVAIDDARILADDGRATHCAVDDLCPALDLSLIHI